MPYILAIDQGTTNSRAIIFDRVGKIYGKHSIPLAQHYPQDGWIEQDPEEMVKNTITACQMALKASGLSVNDIAAIGLTNQRETTIIWDKKTGKPIYPAIIWQDRRTSELCFSLTQHPLSKEVQAKTGLLLDPYFSATKIAWILENVPHAYERALKGELLFGTVDTFLLWKLTKTKAHVTDATNASRTLLFNIHTQAWDEALLKFFNIPAAMLPQVLDNTAHFGELDPAILGKAIPITGVAGDQQAATVGQACFQPGMIKTTYGTGCFMLLNTGKKALNSEHRLLATIAYRINKEITYGLEGSIFNAGSIVKWLRDTLNLIKTAQETEVIASQTLNTGGVYLVPAFTGLGAPYWDPNARGALLGLTRNTSREEIVRAALESVAYQSQDLLSAMMAESESPIKTMRVDGGMTENAWLLQFLSNILRIEVERPHYVETTALGAAYLAGLQIGFYQSLEEIATLWEAYAQYAPTMSLDERDALYEGWQKAVARVLVVC